MAINQKILRPKKNDENLPLLRFLEMLKETASPMATAAVTTPLVGSLSRP